MFQKEAAGKTTPVYLILVPIERHKYLHIPKVLKKVNFTFIQPDFAGDEKTCERYWQIFPKLCDLRKENCSSSICWKTIGIETGISYPFLGNIPFLLRV